MKAYLTIARNRKARATDPGLRKLLRAAARQTLAAAGFEQEAEISLLLTDDANIRKLNAAYRGKDAATDVLSFPLLEDAETAPEAGMMAALDRAAGLLARQFSNGPVLLGDIVISTDRAAAQAQAYGHSYQRETAFLFIHGLLHLLGYDHERGPAAEKAMFALQNLVLEQLRDFFPEGDLH